jgi:thiol-disulfide isomerase/thioredoxin
MTKTTQFVIVVIIIISAIIFLENNKTSYDQTGVEVEEIAKSSYTETIKQMPNLTQAIEEMPTDNTERIQEKEKKFKKAVELIDPDGYINVDNITLKELVGEKIILVDFWTYSCINCQRTFPYLTAWYEKYKDDGFVIVGVHTPEFEFEEDYDNVKRATEKFNINYPVVQDNNYYTWRAYKNRYWPRKYLIDIDGFIVYDHIGEGDYTTTENKIQDLLKERNEVLGIEQDFETDISKPEAESVNRQNVRTPELYFGYKFSRDQLGNKEGWINNEIVEYTPPDFKKPDFFYLEGSWLNNAGSMELQGPGKIYLEYKAKSVNLVAGSVEPVDITITLDGKETETISVKEFGLYRVVDEEEHGSHTLEIESNKGLMAYTFTFG